MRARTDLNLATSDATRGSGSERAFMSAVPSDTSPSALSVPNKRTNKAKVPKHLAFGITYQRIGRPPCLAYSNRAMVRLWTSSGPSAMRKVRTPA